VHKEENCPVKKLPQATAKRVGGAHPNLEFFHVELPEDKGLQFGVTNIGIVYVEAGECDKEELAKEFQSYTKLIGHGK
jgi:hypothetical protein